MILPVKAIGVNINIAQEYWCKYVQYANGYIGVNIVSYSHREHEGHTKPNRLTGSLRTIQTTADEIAHKPKTIS